MRIWVMLVSKVHPGPMEWDYEQSNSSFESSKLKYIHTSLADSLLGRPSPVQRTMYPKQRHKMVTIYFFLQGPLALTSYFNTKHLFIFKSFNVREEKTDEL